jgi:opacity protein-like surface antigen
VCDLKFVGALYQYQAIIHASAMNCFGSAYHIKEIMNSHSVRAISIAIASVCLVGASAAKTHGETVYRSAANLGGPLETSLHSDRPVVDTLAHSYRPQAIAGFEKIARLNLKKLCESFPLNSRCQQSAAPTPESDAVAPIKQDAPTAEKKGPTSGIAVTTTAGTLGAGLELSKAITPHINARLGGSLFEYDMDDTYSSIDYNAKLKLRNVTAAGDFYPWKKSGFHVSLGVAYNGNQLAGSAESMSGTFNINGVNYTANDVGNVKAKISYPSPVAPYIGIGWGNPVALKKRLSFYVKAGVLITGSPTAEFTATPNPTLPQATQDQIIQNVAAEERQLQDSLSNLPVYPVVSVGFSYQF